MKNNLIKKTVKILETGGVIIFPTATVYGLGCLAGRKNAIKKIYLIKGRSLKKPLVLMLSSKSQINKLPFKIKPELKNIIKKIWPHPVTFIVKAPKRFAEKFNSKNKTLGLRLADHPLTKKIISHLKGFLATTSANFSGEKPASSFAEISEELKNIVDLTINGGKSLYSVPSTIIDLTGERPKILRKGALKLNNLKKFLKI